MSQRAKLFEKYRKSDIFNVSSTEPNPVQKISNNPQLPNNLDSLNSTKNKENQIINQSKKIINPRRYVSKHHQSDIFNLNKKFQPEKTAKIQKKRNAQNYSTCFDGMKDNAQYSSEIKEYTNLNRRQKTVYNPIKYFHEENAKQRLYSQYYDTNRNPINNIYQKNKSMMKSSANLLSNMKIDINNNNKSDKLKSEKEVENAFKAHKFNKTKGFTYYDTDGLYDNNKFILNENNLNNSINNCKIKKQLQLQSNIFNDENLQKNESDINKIKQRIKLAENQNETKPKKYFFVNSSKTPTKNDISKKSLENNIEDKNIWGAPHNHWEKSNVDWIKDKTEIIFNKNNTNKDKDISPFQRKLNQLADSNDKDTINESIKSNRKNYNTIQTERYTNNLEQIDEILNDIPDNELKYDKKKQILSNANTTGLNGEPEVDKNILNYNKFHKNNMGKKNQKDLTIKIMSKESQNHLDNKIKQEKICNDLKKFDDYNIYDYVLSYDTRNGPGKNGKNNFDKFTENEVKLLFNKNGIHIYDIKKNMFSNGKYNVIKFKVRENEGEQTLNEKMKEIENTLNKKEYKINIKKEKEKNLKKNLRNVAKAPFTKKLVFTDDNENVNSSKLNEKDKNKQFKRKAAFSSQYGTLNNNYKNHYKEEQLKNKVNK